MLQRQQNEEEAERERNRPANQDEAQHGEEYEALRTQYEQQKPTGLLFPTTYHIKQTVAGPTPTLVPAPGPQNRSVPGQAYSTPLHPQKAPNSYFNSVPVKQEALDEGGMFPLESQDPYLGGTFGGEGDIYSETSSIDQEYDFSGVPSTTMSPFDPTTTSETHSLNEGDATSNYLDFGGADGEGGDMETDEPDEQMDQRLSSSVPSEFPSRDHAPREMSSPPTRMVASASTTPQKAGRVQTRGMHKPTTGSSPPAPVPGNFHFDFNNGGDDFTSPVTGTLIKLEDRRVSTSSVE